jgi:hypothetical protein
VLLASRRSPTQLATWRQRRPAVPARPRDIHAETVTPAPRPGMARVIHAETATRPDRGIPRPAGVIHAEAATADTLKR